MATIIRANGAEDFLALVPHLTGFQPTRSIVLVAFRGNRTCGALRCDLPAAASSSAVRRRAVNTMIGLICRIPDVDALVPVIYTDEPVAAGTQMPHRAVADRILARARDSGFLVRDALCVASDAWGSYLDDDFPPGGRSLDLIAASPARNALDDAGPTTLVDIEKESTVPDADRDAKKRTTQRYAELDGLRGSPELLPVLVFELAFDGDIVALAERILSTTISALSDLDAALLAFLVQGPPARDEVLLTWAWGAEFGVSVRDMNERHHRGENISGFPGALALGGSGMPRPDPSRLRSAIGMLRNTASRVPLRARPPLFTMIGWCHWALGAGTLAGRWVDQARAIDPGYGLAELLDLMLQAGRLPDWAWEVPPGATDTSAIANGR